MQKHVNYVDLVKSFPTNIFLQNLASIQKRTSPIKFDHLAEKSDKGSISNLSTKVAGPVQRGDRRGEPAEDGVGLGPVGAPHGPRHARALRPRLSCRRITVRHPK